MIPLQAPIRLPEIRVVQRSHREFRPEFEGLASLGMLAAIETSYSHLTPPPGHQLLEDDARQLMERTNSALTHNAFQDAGKVDRHDLTVAALGQTESTLAIRTETVEVHLLVWRFTHGLEQVVIDGDAKEAVASDTMACVINE
ncbi:hypothetical protein DL768_008077 [Monosporascus sp. mg162]|nr:hypothetical protein DL768_008077 [Monosporascus sp. mg162]